MPATKLQLNWSNVMLGAQAITFVESVDIDPNDMFSDYAADDNRFPVIAVKPMSKPTAQVVTADVGTAMGTRGMSGFTFTATHLDAKKATGGNVVYSIAGGYVTNVRPTGPFGQYGKATISIAFLSADGATDPISFTRT